MALPVFHKTLSPSTIIASDAIIRLWQERSLWERVPIGFKSAKLHNNPGENIRCDCRQLLGTNNPVCCREAAAAVRSKKTAEGSRRQHHMGSVLHGRALSESWVHIITWQAPPNDSTGLWDQYSRKLPGLILVPLHI